jgi:hypothetical protein
MAKIEELSSSRHSLEKIGRLSGSKRISAMSLNRDVCEPTGVNVVPYHIGHVRLHADALRPHKRQLTSRRPAGLVNVSRLEHCRQVILGVGDAGEMWVAQASFVSNLASEHGIEILDSDGDRPFDGMGNRRDEILE